MKKYHDLEPIKKWHTNDTLRGFDNVKDLPITRLASGVVISVWKVDKLWWRIKFLFSGEVSFTCHGQTHPPVQIALGETLIKKK